MGIHGSQEGSVARRLKTIAAVLGIFLALAALVCQPARAFEEIGGGSQKFKPGDKAPDFTLKDVAGNDVSLSDYAGKKVVLLSFFALRCGTCLMEAPYLESTHRKNRDRDVIVLSVNTDGVDAATAATTMKEVGFETTYTVLLDPDFVATDVYTNFLVPLTLVIDKKGVIRYIHTGFKKGDEKNYEKAIRKAL